MTQNKLKYWIGFSFSFLCIFRLFSKSDISKRNRKTLKFVSSVSENWFGPLESAIRILNRDFCYYNGIDAEFLSLVSQVTKFQDKRLIVDIAMPTNKNLNAHCPGFTWFLFRHLICAHLERMQKICLQFLCDLITGTLYFKANFIDRE